MTVHLFENFNLPEAVADAADTAPAEPTFSASALSAARQEAWNDGYLAASVAHARDLGQECRQVFADLLARSEDMDRKLGAIAEQSAASVARWLVGTFVAAFPVLAAAGPDGRIQVVADLLQPVLRSQSRIELRDRTGSSTFCESMHDVWRQIETRQTEDPTAGDIIVAWPQGEARISSTQIWDDIRAAIMPLATDAADDPPVHFTIKRTEFTGHVR
ncbi:hypothetical protein [Rhodopila sp.]|uniref:hypothetical protein n=1 Tax=Rhodopila sp. TaxID=2480087 RepID=UPI003D11011E